MGMCVFFSLKKNKTASEVVLTRGHTTEPLALILFFISLFLSLFLSPSLFFSFPLSLFFFSPRLSLSLSLSLSLFFSISRFFSSHVHHGLLFDSPFHASAFFHLSLSFSLSSIRSVAFFFFFFPSNYHHYNCRYWKFYLICCAQCCGRKRFVVSAFSLRPSSIIRVGSERHFERSDGTDRMRWTGWRFLHPTPCSALRLIGRLSFKLTNPLATIVSNKK